MTIRSYVSYSAEGKISSMLSCDPDLAEVIMTANTDLPYIEVVEFPDPGVSYVSDGAIASRPEADAYLEGDILKNVLKGAVVVIEGQTYTANGEDIELSFEYPGVYVIKVFSWPKQDQELRYENSPQK